MKNQEEQILELKRKITAMEKKINAADILADAVSEDLWTGEQSTLAIAHSNYINTPRE